MITLVMTAEILTIIIKYVHNYFITHVIIYSTAQLKLNTCTRVSC